MARAGALTALNAFGPQEYFMYDGQSKWMPEINHHTPFSKTHRILPVIQQTSGSYLGNMYQIPIYPKQEGDLLSNMFLSVSLPSISGSYCEMIGRAIIKKAEFIIDGTVLESVDDDWYIIRDQLFLNADEKQSMYNSISAGYQDSTTIPGTSGVTLMIPLDFFFCRRKRRQPKPMLPLCALYNSSIVIRFTFNTSVWITNSATPVDLINPRLVIETITLGPEERLYYQSKPLKFIIPVTSKESSQSFKDGVVRINLTANFKVSMIAWFIRNILYESTTSSTYYSYRYTYGYNTDYIVSAVPLTFWNGVKQNFVDVIDSATMYLNNKNVLSNFPGALYYSYKQPFENKLAVPSKNIYMYCFSDDPSNYSQNSALDFKNLNSQTTYIDMKFNPQLVTQLEQRYNMYLYYYGYKTLNIFNGKLSIEE
jgi:hypothetical protein